MPRFFLFLFLLLLSEIAIAQKGVFSRNDLQVKTSPLAFFEPETIVVQGGLEYFWSEKISTQAEIGINGGILGIPAGRNRQENFEFFRSRNELKFHLKKFYLASELFGVWKNFEMLDDGYYDSQQGIAYERAAIDFRVLGGNIKIGQQKFTSKNIVIDRYIGFGFRERTNSVLVLEGESVGFESSAWTGGRYRTLGQSLLPNLTVGIKIGIMTNKKYR